MKLQEVVNIDKKFLTESYTGDVFYWVESASKNFLDENRITLNPYVYDSEVLKSNNPKKKLYFLSTSRIKFGGYSLSEFYNKKIGIILVLDGNKLSEQMSNRSVDYWGKAFRNSGDTKEQKKYNEMKYNENEERFFSDKPFLAPLNKYVKAIYVYCPAYEKDYKERTDEESDLFFKVIKMAQRANSLRVPFFVTGKESEFKVLKGEAIKAGDYSMTIPDLIHAIKTKTPPTNKNLRFLKDYSYYKNERILKDEAKYMHNDLLNMMNLEKDVMHEFLELMRKSGNRDISSFLKWASELFYPDSKDNK
jgi:hypothetical protein